MSSSVRINDYICFDNRTIIYIYISKSKPLVEIQSRDLITYEQVSYDKVGNEFNEIEPNWIYIRIAPKVVK